MDDEDQGPWFVRVIENKVSVGIYSCHKRELFNLVDETTQPDACEYTRLPPGGFVFGGEIVLHTFQDETYSPHLSGCTLTESWGAVYRDEGFWQRLADPPVANDD